MMVFGFLGVPVAVLSDGFEVPGQCWLGGWTGWP